MPRRFQSTPSGGKATAAARRMRRAAWSFNPRLPGGRRRGWPPPRSRRQRFQSTPSGGKATAAGHGRSPSGRRFNPRLPGGRRPPRRPEHEPDDRVSIHAFRGEGDILHSANISATVRFQSTPSGGKATHHHARSARPRKRFNPRLPGGRRLVASTGVADANSFNPRLPGGRRRDEPWSYLRPEMFQSTPSGGKATKPT